jgi:hypothetical protein
MRYQQNTALYPAYSSTASSRILSTTEGAYSLRGAGWSLCKLAQALCLVPTSHSAYASLKASWEANMGFYYGLYVSGTHQRSGGDAVNVGNLFGFVGSYTDYADPSGPNPSAVYYAFEGWQHGMMQQVLGFAYQLGLPQTTATQALEVLKHACKFAVGSAGGVGGWNYRRFTQYSTVIAAKPLTLYTTWAQALTGQEAWMVLTAQPTTAGLTLKRHLSDTDLTTWQPYFGQQWGALAYAVDSGVANATTGYSNVTGASNYATHVLNFNDDPVYGIVPR